MSELIVGGAAVAEAAALHGNEQEFMSAAQRYKEDLAFKRFAGDRVQLQKAPPMKELDELGRLIWNFHEGQMSVMESIKRFIVACAGRQSGKCVSKGTLVRSANGKCYPIEAFAPGTVVLSYDESSGQMVSSEVLDVMRVGIKVGYRITLGNGLSMVASLDHRFLCDQETGVRWKRMRNLQPDDYVMISHQGPVSCSPIKSIEPVGPIEMYDLEVEGTHNFVAGGMIVHNSESGAPWLYEEMKARGPGWYMVVAPTYPVLEDSALPKFLELFEQYLQLGYLRQAPLRFHLSEDGERRLWGHYNPHGTRTVVRFGHGTNPSSLEAKTSLACWIDEGGQPEFKRESFEAIEGRHATTQGRVFISTTPYDLGFLKTRFYDPWKAYADKGEDHPDIDFISWKSTANPAFPMDEYERLKKTMPAWRHAMFYDGVFGIPSGLIFDILSAREGDISVEPFDIPPRWPRYSGLDFGGVNTCAIYAALDPSEYVLYVYRTYYPGSARRIKDHADSIRREAGGMLERVAGGAKSEGQWRDEFFDNGLMVEQPSITDLNVGIGRVYSLFASGRLRIFSNSCDSTVPLWNQLFDYRYETDPDSGEILPGMKIVNQNAYHFVDGMRYLCTMFGEMLAMGPLGSAGGSRDEIGDYEEVSKRLSGNTKGRVPSSRLGRGGSTGGRLQARNPLAKTAQLLRRRRLFS